MWNPLGGFGKSKKHTKNDNHRKGKRTDQDKDPQPSKAAKREPLDDISNHQKKAVPVKVEKSTKVSWIVEAFF